MAQRTEATNTLLRRLDRFEAELSERLVGLNRTYSGRLNDGDGLPAEHFMPRRSLLPLVVITAVASTTFTIGTVVALKLLGCL